ncbi:MAG TPA: PH domain-containing protein [Actinomycetales bacterium]|nr:PH domain-containing protein [Actinomycetales bacterium]
MPDLSGLHAAFRPRRARRVAYPLAAGALVTMVAVAVVAPGGFGVVDRLGFVVVGVAIAWFLHRQASVRAVPTESGLVVRNLFLGRTLEWAEIVDVRFGGGRPWVQLDLSDGDTLAVMAVQRADGDLAESEARRLATLVALHSRTERDD